MDEADFSPDWLRELDRQVTSGRPSPDVVTVSELMDVYRVPGVGVAAGRVNGPAWATGFGVAGAGSAQPVTAGTAFQACSISKHVAAFGALRLVGDGVLDLDTDVAEYLTSWHLLDREGRRPGVTVRQLLAHTAGLTDTWYRGYAADAAPSLLEVLDGRGPATTPPVRAGLLPGSRFRYSGSHYSVLQQVMVDATGSPFDELMRTLVLQPVGMAGSSFDQLFPHRRPEAVARGHHGGGTGITGGWRTLPEMAAAGLWTTPSDLVLLELEIVRAVAGDSTLLRRDLATQMVTPQIPGGAYGLGTQIDDSAGHRLFGHTGQNVGYTCLSYAWPDSGTAVAVMTNSEDGVEVLAAIRAAADRRYATDADADADAAPIGQVAGRYFLRDDYPIDIAVTNGGLTLTAPGQPPAVLSAGPGGRHLHPGLDVEIRFRQPTGRPVVLELRQEGSTRTATRSPAPPDRPQG